MPGKASGVVFRDRALAAQGAVMDFQAEQFREQGILLAAPNLSEVLFEEINPGNTVKGRVYFDVPKNAKLVKIELHDSMFSGGVDVALRK